MTIKERNEEHDKQRRKTIANNIGYYRYQAGLSQQQLANLLGVRVERVRLYEWNKYEPKITILYRMAEVLKIDIRQLLMTQKEWKEIEENHMNANNKQLTPYEAYLERFAEMNNISIEEAAEKAIVKAVREQYIEAGM